MNLKTNKPLTEAQPGNSISERRSTSRLAKLPGSVDI